MDPVLVKEIMVGIVVGIGFALSLTFMQKARNKIDRHREETGSNNANIGLPLIGLGLLMILVTTMLIIYLSHLLGVEAIYPRGDSRIISLLGSAGRFNWHVSVPALITGVIYAAVYNMVGGRSGTDKKDEADSVKSDQS